MVLEGSVMLVFMVPWIKPGREAGPKSGGQSGPALEPGASLGASVSLDSSANWCCSLVFKQKYSDPPLWANGGASFRPLTWLTS